MDSLAFKFEEDDDEFNGCWTRDGDELYDELDDVDVDEDVDEEWVFK